MAHMWESWGITEDEAAALAERLLSETEMLADAMDTTDILLVVYEWYGKQLKTMLDDDRRAELSDYRRLVDIKARGIEEGQLEDHADRLKDDLRDAMEGRR